MAGKMVHLEIPAGDTAKAREFWGSLFGWQFEEFPGPSEYHVTRGERVRPLADRSGRADARGAGRLAAAARGA